jgi:hypothetical protein
MSSLRRNDDGVRFSVFGVGLWLRAACFGLTLPSDLWESPYDSRGFGKP